MDMQQIRKSQEISLELLEARSLNDYRMWTRSWSVVVIDPPTMQMVAWLIYIALDDTGWSQLIPGSVLNEETAAINIAFSDRCRSDKVTESAYDLVAAGSIMANCYVASDWIDVWERRDLDPTNMVWTLAGMAIIGRLQCTSSLSKAMSALRRSITNAYRYQMYRRLRSRVRTISRTVHRTLHLSHRPLKLTKRMHLVGYTDYIIPHFDQWPYPNIHELKTHH